MPKLSKEYRFKVCVIGGEQSGKTSILNRYVYNEFTHPHTMNIGAEFFTKDLKLDDFDVHLVFFDPGKQNFNKLRATYFKGTSGIVIVFDLTDKDSLKSIEPWLDPLRKKLVGDVPILLLGNKFDLINERQISFKEVWDFAIKHNLIYFETSAKTGAGITEAMSYLARLMIAKGIRIPKKAILIDFKGNKATLSILKRAPDLSEIRLDTPHGISSLATTQELDEPQLRLIDERIDEFTKTINELRRIRGSGVTEHDIKELELNFVRDLKELGQYLYDLTIPPEIQENLKNIKNPLQLAIDETLLGYAWELMHDGEDFLCLKPIGRKIESKNFFVPDINTEIREKLHFLIIVDPKEKDPAFHLPNAKKEGKEIKKLIKRFRNVKSTLLSGEDANREAVLEELSKGIYDFIHFAGHARFNIENPDESGILLADDYLYAYEILEVIQEHPPVLAFINACESSKTEIPEGEVSFESNIFGLASSFLQGGVFYIGALWPIHDDVAIQTAISFYKRLLSEQTIGTALMNAKKEIQNKYGPSELGWLTYILYGDPTMYLKIT